MKKKKKNRKSHLGIYGALFTQKKRDPEKPVNPVRPGLATFSVLSDPNRLSLIRHPTKLGETNRLQLLKRN
jgi:hypothetical protein